MDQFLTCFSKTDNERREKMKNQEQELELDLIDAPTSPNYTPPYFTPPSTVPHPSQYRTYMIPPLSIQSFVHRTVFDN